MESFLSITISLRPNRNFLPPENAFITTCSVILNLPLISFGIKLSNSFGVISEKNPSLPRLIPRIGIFLLLTNFAVLRKVPSPPNENT